MTKPSFFSNENAVPNEKDELPAEEVIPLDSPKLTRDTGYYDASTSKQQPPAKDASKQKNAKEINSAATITYTAT